MKSEASGRWSVPVSRWHLQEDIKEPVLSKCMNGSSISGKALQKRSVWNHSRRHEFRTNLDGTDDEVIYDKSKDSNAHDAFEHLFIYCDEQITLC